MSWNLVTGLPFGNQTMAHFTGRLLRAEVVLLSALPAPSVGDGGLASAMSAGVEHPPLWISSYLSRLKRSRLLLLTFCMTQSDTPTDA